MTWRPYRVAFIGSLFGLLIGIAFLPQYVSAHAGHADIGRAIHGHIDRTTCRFARSDGRHGWSTDEIRKTIRCAESHWSVAGGTPKAVSVARCESGLFYRAVSSSGTYRGVFQQSVNYWGSRYRSLAPDRFDLRPAILNGRTNVVVSVIQAHRAGWSAWSCA